MKFQTERCERFKEYYVCYVFINTWNWNLIKQLYSSNWPIVNHCIMNDIVPYYHYNMWRVVVFRRDKKSTIFQLTKIFSLRRQKKKFMCTTLCTRQKLGKKHILRDAIIYRYILRHQTPVKRASSSEVHCSKDFRVWKKCYSNRKWCKNDDAQKFSSREPKKKTKTVPSLHTRSILIRSFCHVCIVY